MRTSPRATSEWRARPGISALLRILVVLGPVAVSVAASYVVATQLVPRPDGGGQLVGWWVALTALATVVAVVAERVTRRVLPLSALFRLTLVFPDHAPKRYRVALRTGTSRQLARRLAIAKREGLGDTPQEAAEHLVELLAALNAHDRITRGHCERVRAYTDLIATELKLSKDDTSRLHWAGMIHDIGKLEVPAEILNKPGALTADEYEIVKVTPPRAPAWPHPSPAGSASGRTRSTSTTSAGTARATRVASPVSRSAWPDASSRSPTCSTSSPRPGRTRSRARPSRLAVSWRGARARSSIRPSSVPSSTSRSAGCACSSDRCRGWRTCPCSGACRWLRPVPPSPRWPAWPWCSSRSVAGNHPQPQTVSTDRPAAVAAPIDRPASVPISDPDPGPAPAPAPASPRPRTPAAPALPRRCCRRPPRRPHPPRRRRPR